MAGISLLAHSANRSFSRAAPSSIEYSVCTCRCTNEPSWPLAALPAGAAAMKYRLLQACCHETARDGRFRQMPPAGALRYWIGEVLWLYLLLARPLAQPPRR